MKCWYFWPYEQKTIFLKYLILDILIFSNICTKNLFLKVISKQRYLSKCWCFRRYAHKMVKKLIFLKKSKKINIFLDIMIFSNISTKNLFLKVITKQHYLSKCWSFWRYGHKTTYSKWSQNNVIFLKMFAWILLFSEVWTKNDFFKVISKNDLFTEMLVFSDIWVKNGISNLILKKGLLPELLGFLNFDDLKIT